ncbi:hypothetical protein OIU74_028861 [Salix koriyanagi]|uniref:N-acetyltransferase domain-containing protein n=1 Tax=Salix koriyanagi TaxID=2511006 RepID=A0A9Q0VD93_9ROSI|nr:hypothetical protein OIU74_028861 [Salix koriyanagi]
MALLYSSPSLSITSPNYRYYPSRRLCLYPITATHVVAPHLIDKSSLIISETSSEDQLWAAACLRVRSFHEFKPSTFGIQDHKRYLAEREFEALKERIAGKRTGFNRFRENGEDRVVVGTLDVNQCTNLPDEISGKKPEGIEGQFARGYLSNVCVAKELHRNGLGYDIIAKSKAVAQKWGITDLYVHVAVNNEPAKQLYMKSGFVYENDEPAWQARFLDRPRRLLLWLGLPGPDLSLVIGILLRLICSQYGSFRFQSCVFFPLEERIAISSQNHVLLPYLASCFEESPIKASTGLVILGGQVGDGASLCLTVEACRQQKRELRQ